jgi:hypothetical protein
MNRGELERLDRDALIGRAEEAGVTRARILTRQELVDELLLRGAEDDVLKARARGLFGKARDLLARLIERGLNKPDAADLIRSVGRPVPRPSTPAVLPTLTLAEIYVAQGYRERAIETLERVLGAEPEHAAARALLARLRDTAFAVPAPRMPPEAETDEVAAAAAAAGHVPGSADPPPQAAEAAKNPTAVLPSLEPSHMLDEGALPRRYDVDECVAIAVEPRTLYVYWEIRDATMEGLRRRWPDAVTIVRIVAVEPSWQGPKTSLRDEEVREPLGELFATDLPAGALIRAAVGARIGADFVSIAHGSAVEMPPLGPAVLSSRALRVWTEPSTEDSVSPVGDVARQAIDRVFKNATLVSRQVQPVVSVPPLEPLGGSDLLATSASE